MSNPNVRFFKALRTYCDTAAAAVVALGCLVLFGWAVHIQILKSVLPGLVTMEAKTALSLALSGISLR